MTLKLYTAPIIEPVSLAEVKLHLRVDSEDHAGDISLSQSIVPGPHGVAAAYSLVGSSIDVSGYSVLVFLDSGTNGSNGTVDVKLQESDNNSTWTDVTSGAFTQVTTANDNAIQEKAYTGIKRYIRAVAMVSVATCDFGVSVLKDASTSVEDDLLNSLITTAREYCEGVQNRAYLTQTWELWLDAFPYKDHILIPRSPLASITSIKYYDTANAEVTMTASDYFVDTKSEPGRVCLAYGKSWPTATLRPINGVCITFVAGETAAASVKKKWKQAILLHIEILYDREPANRDNLEKARDALLWLDRLSLI